MNGRNIVIPTFIGDQDLLIWQIRSFDRFLTTPVRIHYVLNDLENKSYLRSLIQGLASKYSTHEIIITDCDQLDIWDQLPTKIKNHGWKSQQIIKLFYPLDRAYLVMDTKDLMLKPRQWEDIFQHHPLINVDTLPFQFREFWQELGKILQSTPNFTRGISTPQIVDPEVANKTVWTFKTTENLLEWFGDFMYPAEFLLYDCVQQYNNHYDVTRTLKRNIYLNLRDIHDMSHEILINGIKDFESNPIAFIMRIHRTMINDQKIQSTLYSWLSSKFRS